MSTQPDALSRLNPATADWFRGAFGQPTQAQAMAWEYLASGAHTVVIAPTGSGKTLAAFLLALDRLVAAEPEPSAVQPGTRVLYISPLKALAVDVERNLRAPLVGITQAARARNLEPRPVTVGIRTGDTPPAERRNQQRNPPDILVTTPESLYLLLTSAARESLRTVDTVIIDEIHAVAGTKRGAHLALSLERLDALLDSTAQRIGLSATVRPHEEVARFLAGNHPVQVAAPPASKKFDLSVTVPVEDLSDLSSAPPGREVAPGTPGQGSVWPHVEREIVDLIRAHRSTIVFANSRRLAERITARINEIHAEDTDPDSLPELPQRPPAQIMASSDLSRGAPAELAMAHHGSVSKERRSLIEDDLKSGRLRAVVATSSLELGIDMGEVDLVVQVAAPPSVASGLQRVGRAGHQVGETSRATVFPTHRADLLHCSVTVERMLSGEIENLTVVANPLDVLAQQTVAACALDDIDVQDWYALVRRAAPFSSLPWEVFTATLDMLAGKYPSADFAELRPRLVWDRDSGVLRGRPGAQRLAVTSGGTIPDRGLFSVFMVGEQPTRVGELDEEMVYESRVGDVIALGASSWKVEQITHDRVIVSPAPGGAGRLPFWIGDDQGRPAALGYALGAFVREVAAGAEREVDRRLAAAGLDQYAAGNLRRYLVEQREATGHVPCDTTLVIERFRDEVGDWRVVLHSPFGSRVHWPWAEAIRARLSATYGVDPVPVVSDDGIILRIPDTLDDTGSSVVPGAEAFALDPHEAVDLVTTHIGGTALFASRFRECSARALLLPRLDPGRRSPLWQQRQKSAQLLDVARAYPEFPMILEAVRECLQDVYDVPALQKLLGDIQARTVQIVEVETSGASPFAQSLLFGYVGSFMYEGDSPLAEKRAAALSVDPTLLGQLLGRVELRELLEASVLEDIERELQHLNPERAVRDAEGVADLLRLLGPLTAAEIVARSGSAGEDQVRQWLESLQREHRVVNVERTGELWWAGVEEVARLRDGLGIPTPLGVPTEFLAPSTDPLGELLRRYARTHGPFTTDEVATRFGLGAAVARGVLEGLAASGAVVAGEFRPGAGGAEWCESEVLRRIRRRSLAALRKQIEPVSQSALGRFLPSWQGIDGRGAEQGIDGVLAVIEQLEGSVLPASAWEQLVFAARVRDYSPAMLDELLSGGEVLWCGRGRSGARDGWISLHPVDTALLTLPVERGEAANEIHTAVLDSLAGGGQFLRDIVTAVRVRLADTSEAEIGTALWDLVWDGLVSNDTFAPMRAVLAGGGQSGAGTAHRARRSGARPRRARLGRSSVVQVDGARALGSRTPPALSGRWSLLPNTPLEPTAAEVTVRAHAWAQALLGRYGVVTRGAVEAEGIPGGFAAVYKVLAEMEAAGQCRRGYFIEGLGAAQFASGATVDRLRSVDDTPDDTSWPSGKNHPDVRVLASTDPANPYGAALPWPQSEAGHRPGRKAGAVVVLVDGLCALYLERGGKTLLVFELPSASATAIPAAAAAPSTTSGKAEISPGPKAIVPIAAAALVEYVRAGRIGPLVVTAINGVPVHASVHASALRSVGFAATPKGLRIRR